jgi:hypothetical protein
MLTLRTTGGGIACVAVQKVQDALDLWLENNGNLTIR